MTFLQIMTIMTSRGVVHLLKPRSPHNHICMHWRMFPCSFNIFHIFPVDGFFFWACPSPNTNPIFTVTSLNNSSSVFLTSIFLPSALVRLLPDFFPLLPSFNLSIFFYFSSTWYSHIHHLSRSLMVDFILFPLFILFYFFFSFYFSFFLFLEQLGLGFISHAVTSVTKAIAQSQD